MADIERLSRLAELGDTEALAALLREIERSHDVEAARKVFEGHKQKPSRVVGVWLEGLWDRAPSLLVEIQKGGGCPWREDPADTGVVFSPVPLGQRWKSALVTMHIEEMRKAATVWRHPRTTLMDVMREVCAQLYGMVAAAGGIRRCVAVEVATTGLRGRVMHRVRWSLEARQWIVER
jgi:hypothetical protein